MALDNCYKQVSPFILRTEVTFFLNIAGTQVGCEHQDWSHLGWVNLSSTDTEKLRLKCRKAKAAGPKKKEKKRAIFANAVCVVASNCVLCPFTLEINIASFKPVTLLAVRPLCASLNFYIKAQCASAFHHLFIWANGMVHGDSMIRRSEEMHSALHPHAHTHTHVCTHAALLAFANCIFIKKDRGQGHFITNTVVGSSGSALDL